MVRDIRPQRQRPLKLSQYAFMNCTCPSGKHLSPCEHDYRPNQLQRSPGTRTSDLGISLVAERVARGFTAAEPPARPQLQGRAHRSACWSQPPPSPPRLAMTANTHLDPYLPYPAQAYPHSPDASRPVARPPAHAFTNALPPLGTENCKDRSYPPGQCMLRTAFPACER